MLVVSHNLPWWWGGVHAAAATDRAVDRLLDGLVDGFDRADARTAVHYATI